jgi:DNA replication protein DnaC
MFGAFFHQDWDREGEDWPDLVRNFATGQPQSATALRLPTVKAECEEVARQCASENIDYLGFLLRLCDRELSDRERRAGTRRLAAARWPRLKTLDEFGYVPASQAGAELLFDVLSTAYQKTSGSVTTNLAFERWTEVLGHERLVGATLDRLTHRCHLLEATGESYRLKEARRRQEAATEKGGERQKNIILR